MLKCAPPSYVWSEVLNDLSPPLLYIICTLLNMNNVKTITFTLYLLSCGSIVYGVHQQMFENIYYIKRENLIP